MSQHHIIKWKELNNSVVKDEKRINGHIEKWRKVIYDIEFNEEQQLMVYRDNRIIVSELFVCCHCYL